MSENYLMGMSVGLLLGIAIGYPGSDELIVKLGDEDADALKHGNITEQTEERICNKIDFALREFRQNGEVIIEVCREPEQDTQAQARRRVKAPRPG